MMSAKNQISVEFPQTLKKLLILLSFIYWVFGLGQTQPLDAIQIQPTEISSDYKILENLQCQSIQSKLLYEKPDMYSLFLGKLLSKKFQTFDYKGDQGSILYLEFDKDAENGRKFVEGLLWGGKKPNNAHPENIITKGNIMIILSFPFKSEILKELTELIAEK